MKDEALMQLMHHYGYKYSNIAKALDVSREAVRKWVKVGGFPKKRALQLEALTQIKSEDLECDCISDKS